MRIRMTVALALAVGCSTPLLGHHGTAAFESDKKLTLKGTVTEWLWSNPHCLLQFDVKADDGKVVHWVGETQNPVTMTNMGWSKAAIRTGDKVTVILVPVKNGLPLGRVVTVVLPNGKTLDSNDRQAEPYSNQRSAR